MKIYEQFWRGFRQGYLFGFIAAVIVSALILIFLFL